MFTILNLNSGSNDTLQSLQNNYEIEAVSVLGQDSSFERYLLVQYDTAPPSSQVSGSVPVEQAKKPVSKGK